MYLLFMKGKRRIDMFAVLKKEYLSVFKYFKMIGIVLLFVLLSYCVKIFSTKYPENNIEVSSLYDSFNYLLTIGGYVFITVFSAKTIQTEMNMGNSDNKKKKTYKTKFFLKCYLLKLLYWYSCMIFANIVISIIEKRNYFSNVEYSIVMITYFVSLIFLISSLIVSYKLSVYVSLLAGTFISILGKSTESTSSLMWSRIRCIFPYYYISKEEIYLLIPLVLSAGMACTSLLIFQGKEL